MEDDDGITITGGEFVDGSETGELTLPDRIGASKVTSIAADAFFSREDITTVVLPSTLRSIGEYAFAVCANLRTVTGGENLERVGRDAFSDTPFLYGVDSLDDVDDSGYVSP